MKVLLLLALVSVAAATSSYEAVFRQWMSEHGKSYRDDAEFQLRLSVFSDNARYIDAENAKGNSWTLGYTQFADLTNEEYRNTVLMRPTNFTWEPVVEAPTAVPAVDWRNSGCVTGVKNQGQCGSCYTFSAAASMEFCHCMAAGKPVVSLSEQQCVDCSAAYGNMGCSGGWQENCWKYFIANKGEDTESSYGYTGVKGTCKASSATVGSKVNSWASCTATESGLQACISKQVTSVAIDASLSSFQLYKSGVYCPAGCSTTSLDHAVTAVGMGTTSGTYPDYYIVKNSWGTTWGIQGYIWMCANQNNHCGICTHANYPTQCS